MDEEGSSVAGSLSHRNAHAPTAARGDPQSGAVQGKKKSADTAWPITEPCAVLTPPLSDQSAECMAVFQMEHFCIPVHCS
ncbi:hypothetical protein KOW79_021795 [Hemibagrus wyckioides]|uniref:Uncharacterized protein n=1 Tax=Hemibagrus wyckioides TaxID=337641 RepID=A0A9D3N4Y5_9TELE|nr:hypothetical protein KOW79_021795 [Hemibagrus wyckioides]